MRWPWVSRGAYVELERHLDALHVLYAGAHGALAAANARYETLALRLADLAAPDPIPTPAAPEKPLPDEVSAVLDELGLYGTQRVREEAVARRWMANEGATAKEVAALLRAGGQPAEVGA